MPRMHNTEVLIFDQKSVQGHNTPKKVFFVRNNQNYNIPLTRCLLVADEVPVRESQVTMIHQKTQKKIVELQGNAHFFVSLQHV